MYLKLIMPKIVNYYIIKGVLSYIINGTTFKTKRRIKIFKK